MPFEPGPVQVVRSAFSSNAERLDDLSGVDLWPTTYVSGWMVDIVGIPMVANLLEALELPPPDTSPPSADGVWP